MFMLHMKFLRNSLTAVTLFLLSAVLNAAETTAPKTDKYKQTPEMATISRAAAYLIANSHFNQQQINEKISSQLFDDYFKALDPTRMFFTAEDIKSFEPQKKQLGTQIRMGNVQFAFDVFKLFVKRLEEYEKFTAEYLKKKPDLTANEEFDVNRSKAPWAANRAELEQFWIKKTKNDLILLNLMELAKKEEAKKTAKPEKAVAGKDRTQKKDAKAAGESVAAKTAVKLPPPSTPEERTLKRVDQFVQFYKNMEAVDILEVYLSSLTRIYDPHSEYMSPRTEEDFNIGMKLSLVGIGALLTNEDGYTKIVKIIPGRSRRCGRASESRRQDHCGRSGEFRSCGHPRHAGFKSRGTYSRKREYESFADGSGWLQRRRRGTDRHYLEAGEGASERIRGVRQSA